MCNDAPVGQPAKELEGKLIGSRFRVRGELGSGGMGAVYEAEDTVLGRPVALKLLHVDSDEHAARLEREARAASRITDPGVAIVHDVGQDAEVGLYLVMERMRGQTLEEMTADGTPLPIPRVVGLMRRVVAALNAAHTAGVVHRDLKPANIFMLENGGVKVMDFGIAKIVRGSKTDTETLTDVESIVGTPAYIAPEAVRKGDVGPPADIYALGIILFELLTGGRRPFESDDPVMLCAAHLKERPPKVTTVADQTVPPPLVGLIDRMLRKEPGRRPSLDEIDRVLGPLAKATGTHPAPAFRREWRVPAIAAVVALVVIGIIAFASGDEGEDPEPYGTTSLRPEDETPVMEATPVEDPIVEEPTMDEPSGLEVPEITITVSTTPPTATVLWDGDEVDSPFVVLADGLEHELQVSARGRVPETHRILANESRIIDIDLRRATMRMRMNMMSMDVNPAPW